MPQHRPGRRIGVGILRPSRGHLARWCKEVIDSPDSIGVTDLAITGDGGLVLGAWAHHGDPAGVAVWSQQGDTPPPGSTTQHPLAPTTIVSDQRQNPVPDKGGA